MKTFSDHKVIFFILEILSFTSLGILSFYLPFYYIFIVFPVVSILICASFYFKKYIQSFLLALLLFVNMIGLQYLTFIDDVYFMWTTAILGLIMSTYTYFFTKDILPQKPIVKINTFQPEQVFVKMVNNKQYYFVGTIHMITSAPRSIKVLDKHIVVYKDAIFIKAFLHDVGIVSGEWDVLVQGQDVYIAQK